jgi:polyisoprenoid-binding protein YceI
MDVATQSQGVESVSVPGTVWTIDPVHSTIGFSIKHLRVATVHGKFGDFRGTIRYDDEYPDASFVEVEIDASSIDTREKKRDEHLRSADFFDVTVYPAITFRSTRAEPVSQLRRDRWLVVGDLTIHGVTHSVKLAVEQSGAGPHSGSAEEISFSATTMISRKAFGVGYNSALDGELLIADDVSIRIDIQAHKAPVSGR